MRAGLAVLIVIAIGRPELARSQTHTDMDATLTIAIHPEVSTILQLPDEIVHTWIDHHGEIMVARVGSQLAVRPRASTPAGVEASLEVETLTLHRTFRLLVVERARDAKLDVLVLPVERTQESEESAPAASPVTPMEPEAPDASASANGPSQPVPAAKPDPAPAEPVTERDTEPTAERAAATASAPQFELSLHALVALVGTTALHIAGYDGTEARQPHRAFGVRVAGRPRGAWWAVEANVSGEWPVAPTTHRLIGGDEGQRLEVDGPWLRADVGLRAKLGTRWIPTAYAGMGLQAHHRDIRSLRTGDDELTGGMPFGGVLVLGMGLEYRAGDLLLGLELHVRQGVPADYRSTAALLSVGCFLDPGENEL